MVGDPPEGSPFPIKPPAGVLVDKPGVQDLEGDQTVVFLLMSPIHRPVPATGHQLEYLQSGDDGKARWIARWRGEGWFGGHGKSFQVGVIPSSKRTDHASSTK